MKNLLYKEFALATPLLSVLFLGFTAMTFIPGYPILCGAFFVCFGIFQGYQTGVEGNDILYTVLLPVKKTDVVKAKYAASVILQMLAFVLFAAFTAVRMVFFSHSAVYVSNPLMGANPVFLAFVLVIFGCFNLFFLGGFFKTAYRYGKPFLCFSAVNFAVIAVAEVLHHLPGLHWLNAPDQSHIGKQLSLLAAAAVLYLTVTGISCKRSQDRIEKLDL